MIPHPIRLRQPWDELPADQPGHVVYRRRFQRPSNLDAWERVTLEIDRGMYSGEIVLNGVALGRLEPGQFFAADVTVLLEQSNELKVEVDTQTKLCSAPISESIYIVDPAEPLGSPIGDVRLVIRAEH